MRASRIAFAIADLDREVRKLAPHGPPMQIVLGAGTFRPVVEELASHFGVPAAPGLREYPVGLVLIRSGD